MIRVVDYDPSWPRRFEALRNEYSAAFARAGVAVVAIEHVGSTSVPGLAAKPIIDCDIVVTAERVTPASDVLVHLGFQPEGELGVPQRWAFKEPSRLRGTHTYVIVDGSLALRDHLRLRDALRTNAELCARYSSVKKRVGATAGNVEEYAQGKAAVIQQILETAGLNDQQRHTSHVARVRSPGEAPR